MSSKGRAAVKTQEGAGVKAINVTNSVICLDPDAGSGEATMILSGNQNSTLTLNDGAIIQKDSASNNTPNAGGSVIYMLNNGNHSIVMNAGSMIWAAHKSGTSASCIGLGSGDTKGSNSVTINEGAFLYAAANVSKFYFFGQNGNTNTINAYDGAFLTADDATFTLEGFVLNSSVRCSYEKMENGVYKMVREAITDYDFEVGSTKIIGTFADALNKAADGETIKLLDNFDTTEANIGLSGKNVVLDLNGFTFNGTGGAYLINSLKSTLTITNGTFKVSRGIIVQAGGHLKFENVTAISSDGTGSNSRPLVKLSAGNCKLTVKNATLESKTTIGEALILSEGGSTGTIDLLENAVVKYSGDLGSNDQNHTAISNQGTTTLVINVSSTAKIIAAHKSSTKAKVATAICQDAAGIVTVNLEKGATLVADRTLNADNVSSTKFIHDKTPDTGSVTVYDNGANYVVSPDVAKQGIVIPANPFGYKIGDTAITLADGNVYQNAAATETVTITSVSYSFKPEMITGAAMRLEMPFGLRFGATIDAEAYAKILELDPNAEIGFVVAKKGDAGNDFDTTKMLETKYQYLTATSVVNADGVVTFEANVYIGEDSIITSADKTGFKLNVAAKAYIKATINGEEVYYWADYSMVDNSRSLYKVAQSYVADTVDGSTTNVVANYIIAVCEK